MSVEGMAGGIGILDIVVFLGVLGSAAYYYISRKKQVAPVFKKLTINPLASHDRSFIRRMKNGGRSVVVFFGSQTGTAEEFASRLSKESSRYGLKALTVDPEDCEMDDLTKLPEIENSLAVFMMATYGEGDPTDNAQEFIDWLKEGNADLTGLRYAVFGLGNKTYEHFNSIGKYVDNRLEELGAERVFELGLGDDDANIEEDYLTWKEKFWPVVCEYFGVADAGEEISARQYSLVLQDNIPKDKTFTGEPSKIGSLRNQKPPFDPKNPFLATVIVKRELHKGGSRSCLHIELDLTDSKIRYECGDHAAILPRNNATIVQWIGDRLKVDLDVVFTLNNNDAEATKSHPFPCPTTYRMALTHYLDITSCPRTNVLKDIAQYANEEERDFLLSLTKSTHESKEAYLDWIVSKHRTIIHVLEDLKSLNPPIDHLCELLPRLQVRYYSISSSPRVNPSRLSITAVVVEYVTKLNRPMMGVATGMLGSMDPSETVSPKVPVFVRRSQFKLPYKSALPVVMVGPGTGLAPFMGFLQEKLYQKQEGKPIGNIYLYFGCRHRNEDFIYEQELQKFLDEEVLTKLYVAFSRDQEKKVYVQHLMEQNGKEIWETLEQKGHFYVCGDARNMAHDVDLTLHKIAIKHGNLDSASASDYIKRMRSSGKYSCDVWS